MSDGIPAESAVVLGALAGAVVVASCAAWWFWRRAHTQDAAPHASSRGEDLADPRNRRDAALSGDGREPPSAPDASEVPQFIRFDEPALDRVEQAFEKLLAQGVLAAEPTTEEALVLARVPAHVGPVFRALARRYRSVVFQEVGVRIVLHDGEIADDALGGWRLRAEPEELDIRLPPPGGWADAPGGDVIVDATWSPQAGSEVAQHSTMLHFLVRAAVGDRI
ncbi:MAG: hypothetical protein LW806_02290 [Planctomycetaceae bacterium]|nr:hypothetical protein [Planctomycetaceae bacterium]